MREKIQKRMVKVIDYAVKAFVKEHYKDHKELNINEIADGLTFKMIEHLDFQEGKSSS
jgi:hypothetical protein